MKSSRRMQYGRDEAKGRPWGCPHPLRMPAEERQQGEKSKKKQSGKKEENPRKKGSRAEHGQSYPMLYRRYVQGRPRRLGNVEVTGNLQQSSLLEVGGEKLTFQCIPINTNSFNKTL